MQSSKSAAPSLQAPMMSLLPVPTSFKLACFDPFELHRAVGVLALRGRSQAGPTPTQEIALLDLARNFL